MNSPIVYYGGKSYMTDTLKSYFPNSYNVYVEGFGGGASLLLSCDNKNKIEIYNDLYENVYSLFKCLQNNKLFTKLKTKVDLTYYSHELFDKFKRRLLKDDLSTLKRAYYYLMVNRMSFNGCGGFKVDSTNVRNGMSKSTSDFLTMIEGLEELHIRLKSVIIENLDVFDLIDKYDNKNVFMYLDPPYVQSTRKSNQKYAVEMSDSLHKKLCKRLLTFKGKVLVSGYDNSIYDILTDNGFKKVSFTPKQFCKTKETIWMNYSNCKVERIF